MESGIRRLMSRFLHLIPELITKFPFPRFPFYQWYRWSQEYNFIRILFFSITKIDFLKYIIYYLSFQNGCEYLCVYNWNMNCLYDLRAYLFITYKIRVNIYMLIIIVSIILSHSAHVRLIFIIQNGQLLLDTVQLGFQITLPYDPVCPSVGRSVSRSVCHNFPKFQFHAPIGALVYS